MCTWISPSKGTKLLLYRWDHARSKLRPFHVKIIVCRSFMEEEDGENRGLPDFRIFLGRETLEDHSQLPKWANKCSIQAVASFSYV